MRVVYSLVSILLLLLVSMFGYADGAEIHKNGFEGITPFNTTGLTIFNDTLKRSFDYETESLALSSDFSILETNGDIRDFSLFDNDLTINNAPQYVNGEFGTSLQTLKSGSGQWAEASHSESLDMENTNISLVWWGQIKSTGTLVHITGKGCSSITYVYGLYLDSSNQISAFVSNSACTFDQIPSNLPVGGLDLERTYGIGLVFEDSPSGSTVHFWLDGEWIYQETSSIRVGDTNSLYYVGRSTLAAASGFCDCEHDEVLVFKERLTNDTMKLLTTKQHDIVIRSGPATTTQGFGGLFLALPWLIVFGLLGWLFFIIFMAWKKAFD